MLKEVIQVMTVNLNNIIDYNYYPTKTETSNLRHRPVVKIQFSKCIMELKIITSDEAKQLNEDILKQFTMLQWNHLWNLQEMGKR